MRPTSTSLFNCRKTILFTHQLILWVILLSQNGYLVNQSHAVKPGSLVRIEDLEEFCLNKAKESKDLKDVNHFLYNYEPSHEGCTVKCIFLKSTSQKHKEYFDYAVTVPLHLRDYRCRDENHICDYGSCKSIESTTVPPTPIIEPTQFGTVVLYIKDGYIRNADANEKTPPDTYIKFSVKRKTLKTTIAKDTYRPVWNEEFTLQNINVDDNLTLVIMDDDRKIDDKLGEVIIFPREVLNNGNNTKFVEYPFGDKLDHINVRLTWFNQ